MQSFALSDLKPLVLSPHSAGSRICSLPLRAAPNTSEPRSRGQRLPGVLHAAPPTEAGGPAGAAHSRPLLWPRHGGTAHHHCRCHRFLPAAAGEIRRVVLQRPREATLQRPTACRLGAAPSGAEQGPGLVAEPPGLFRAQGERPGDGGGRSDGRIPRHRHHPGAAVPGGRVEHLQGKQLPATTQSGTSFC